MVLGVRITDRGWHPRRRMSLLPAWGRAALDANFVGGVAIEGLHTPSGPLTLPSPLHWREEGRGKRGEGKRGEGRGKREEGRGKREEGRGKREEGRGKREEGR